MNKDICKIISCGKRVKCRELCSMHYKRAYEKATEKTRLYDIWRSMVARCYDEDHKSFEYYGGRGISVCTRWLIGTLMIKPYKLFALDMGPRLTKDLSLERIDNNGNYEPSNCRWATRTEQHRNKRSNKLITYKGTTKCLSEWAELLGIPRESIDSRLRRGWSIEDALFGRR